MAFIARAYSAALFSKPIRKNLMALKIRGRQLAIFPGGGPPSIVTAMSLYDRVRDGNGCFPHDLPPANLCLMRFTLAFHTLKTA